MQMTGVEGELTIYTAAAEKQRLQAFYTATMCWN
jgi:hypothetical protein